MSLVLQQRQEEERHTMVLHGVPEMDLPQTEARNRLFFSLAQKSSIHATIKLCTTEHLLILLYL